MMKYLYVVFMFTLSGCATWFPASVQEIEEGTYMISAFGNSFASQEGMSEKIHKKADSLCAGNGYEKVVAEDTKWTHQKDYSTGMTESFKTMSMTISCNS
ncbi:MAG: hypothetical protein HRU21_12010 [Pseudomonadales bacterium]|nr:hypothetical protein [Pseudomonadales bacterium]